MSLIPEIMWFLLDKTHDATLQKQTQSYDATLQNNATFKDVRNVDVRSRWMVRYLQESYKPSCFTLPVLMRMDGQLGQRVL